MTLVARAERVRKPSALVPALAALAAVATAPPPSRARQVETDSGGLAELREGSTAPNPKFES